MIALAVGSIVQLFSTDEIERNLATIAEAEEA
jgi:hypothetical protein